MILLALETTGRRGSVAVFDGRSCLGETALEEGMVQGREVVAGVEDLLRAHGLGPRDLGAIAVGLGPGSYTGSRVGVTTAKTMGFALRIPVLGESSFAVMAANACGDVSATTRVVPVLDGRQGFLFWGAYLVRPGSETSVSPGVEADIPDRATPREDALRAIARPAVAIGDGAALLVEAGGAEGIARGPASWDLPRAGVLGRLVTPRLAGASFDLAAIHALQPSYLRATEAERKLAAKGGAC